MAKEYIIVNTKLSGEKIHAVIKKSGYSIRELQEMLDLSCPNPIYKWIHGERLPSTVNLYRLSCILGITMESLLVGENITIVTKILKNYLMKQLNGVKSLLTKLEFNHLRKSAGIA